MNTRLLCDIPIYGISKEKYETRLSLERKKYYNVIMQYSDGCDELSQMAAQNKYLQYAVWKYNQMDGFIEVLIQNWDIVFKIYMAEIKHHQCFSNSKNYYMYIPSVGLNFWTRDKDNEEIVRRILENVDLIQNNYLYKKDCFLDTTTLNNMLKHIDIKGFIEENNN